MLLKYFYDRHLAQASYLVGCQKSGEAVVIDPARNIVPYLEAAAAEGLRIVGAIETHIHADFVSGSRELADRVGARLYLSDEGPAEWKYQFASQYDSRLLKDGDSFSIGRVRFDVLHTPGHTPESLSYLLTDVGGGATTPMGIFTGDFVFVGSIGRPDLLETAAGIVGSAEIGAHQLYRSVQRFLQLPDHLQIWPAHGAGSACGKGLGAIPSSTVGYERMYNPALQIHDEQAFVKEILTDQPETPFYFAVMKRVNKVGPDLLSELPPVTDVPTERIAALAREMLVIDTTAAPRFAEQHVPGTLNVPAEQLAAWAGFFVGDGQPVLLLTDPARLDRDLEQLRSIGIDRVIGYVDAGVLRKTGWARASSRSVAPADIAEAVRDHQVRVLDVRAETEFREGHLPGAQHLFLGHLLRDLSRVDRSRPVLVNCLGGARSAIAVSVLERAGIDVIDLRGGYRAWAGAGLPVTTDAENPATVIA